MPVQTLYEEVGDVLTKLLKNALRTGEIVNALDRVEDLAACLAFAVTMVDEQDLPGLRNFAHLKLDEAIERRLVQKRSERQ